jgi:hypothetical protein
MSLKLKPLSNLLSFLHCLSHRCSINLLSNNITFRQYENPMNFNLSLWRFADLGGSSGEFGDGCGGNS